ncbi:hypothetical protein WJX73_000652 [Symbiochloris irregularis]|uniref:Apoptosis antagonizing transcription factor n=1 Tax=Symbiochloris irregularis TaxID=706552 RepID=A0AAW1P1R7_9CHLO
MGKRSFAEQIKELTEVAPTVEPGDEFEEVPEVASDPDQELLPSVGGARGLPLRAAAVSEGTGAYTGRKTPRREALGQEASDEDSDASETDEDADEAGPAKRLRKEASSSEDEDASDSEDLSDQSGLEDPDEDAQDSQYAQLEAEGAAALRADMQRRRQREAVQGVAVKNQCSIWERILEIRILLQKAVGGSHSLPGPAGRAHALQDKGVHKAYRECCQGISATLTDLMDLNAALRLQHPGTKQAESSQQYPHSRQPGSDGKHTTPSAELWDDLAAAHEATDTFRDASLDQWYRQVMLQRGSAAMRSNAKVLGQGISSQVQAAMADGDRLISRSQLEASQAPKRFFEAFEGAALDADDDARLPDLYDDSSFYEQLLREFLEGSAAGGAVALAGPAAKAKKKRTAREPRASKGRRLRYDVQDKLVNFMAPVNSDAPPISFQLFGALFGTQAAKK